LALSHHNSNNWLTPSAALCRFFARCLPRFLCSGALSNSFVVNFGESGVVGFVVNSDSGFEKFG
jgi:hypothetical protein